MIIKYKRYYRWNQDTELKDSVARKGEIFTHYQGMNESLTLINREPLTEWLAFTGADDKEGVGLYDQDIIKLPNRMLLVVSYNAKDLRWIGRDTLGQPHGIDRNISLIVGNKALDNAQ
jgi:hypothetical protein